MIVIILKNYLYGSDRFATHNISSNPIIITQIMSLTPTANSLLKCIFTLSDAMVSLVPDFSCMSVNNSKRSTTENMAVASDTVVSVACNVFEFHLHCSCIFKKKPAAPPVPAMQAFHLKDRLYLELAQSVSISILFKSNQCNAFP